MIHPQSFTVWLIAAALLLCPAAAACEYSVRDAAFVCYRHEEYVLTVFVRHTTPAAVRTLLEEAALVQCLDSNVRFEVVDADAEAGHPLLAGRRPAMATGSPFAILTAPDGRSLILPLELGVSPSRETVWPIFERVVASPARRAITEVVVDALSVVVLVEGTDQDQNRRAEMVVGEAISRIAQMMPYFPKPVHAPARLDEGPRLVTVARDALAGEEILLWSLGLDTRPAERPQVVVLHGRGRQIGWPLSKEELEPSLLARILSVSGQDCECDLPRSWFQGRVIPLRWDEEILTPLAKALGFNPESPAVVNEVSLIVGAGSRAFASKGANDLPEISLGYNEIEIGFAPDVDGDRSRRSDGASDDADGSGSPQEPEASVGTPLLLTCLLIAVTLLAWGLVLVRRKQSGRRP